MADEKKERKLYAVEIVIRILLVILSCIMICWYFISRIANIGSILGTVFFALIGASAIFAKQIFKIAEKMKKRKVTKVIFEIISVTVTAIFIYIFVILGAMTYCANRKPAEQATVVVLGCQVRGRTPSLMLGRRIDTAYEYLVSHPDAKCVVSGGQGNGEAISEARCMYDILVEKGIASDRIYMEDKSTNTKENIAFSAEIIEKENLNPKLAIVTDGFHEMRAAIITTRLGYSCGAVSAPTPTYISANFTTREVLALTAEIIFGK